MRAQTDANPCLRPLLDGLVVAEIFQSLGLGGGPFNVRKRKEETTSCYAKIFLWGESELKIRKKLRRGSTPFSPRAMRW